MLYVSCDLKPYMCFDFSKLVNLWPIYVLLLALWQNPLIIDFSGSFRTFQNRQGSLNQACPAFLAQTYPTSWTCPVSGFWLYKGVCTPSNAKPTKSSPLLSCGGQWSPKAILDLHWIPLVSRRFGSPTPCDLQTLVGFLSRKVYSRFLQDFFVLHQSLRMHCFICLGVPLGYLWLALKSCLEWISISCKLKTRFSYLNLVIYLLILQWKLYPSSMLFLGC
jgi:hypothetical protein